MYETLGTYTPDNLISGTEINTTCKEVKLKIGQGILVRGTVLGKLTAEDACKIVDKANADGTETAYCILTDTIDTDVAEDVTTTGYFTGIFNPDALTFATLNTVADHELELRKLGIHLRKTQA